MGKLKKYAWLVLRFCILGPLAVCCVVSRALAGAFETVGGWFEESFNNISPLLWPDDWED